MARRIAQSSVNWAALAERVPAEQKAQFMAFKSKSDGFLRRVLANPAEPAKIDWSFYKSKIPNAALVDSLQKQYESLKIPFPADTGTKVIESEAVQVAKRVQEFKAQSAEIIADNEKQLAKYEAMIPYEQMTMEDFKDAHPEHALDPYNRPTFWPHLPEYQPDYVEPEKKIEAESHK